MKNLVEKYKACVPPAPGRGEPAHIHGGVGEENAPLVPGRGKLANGYGRWSGFIGQLKAEWQEAEPVFELLGTPRKKGIHIKQHTPQHTQLIGYQYRFALTAPPALHELGYYAGFGEKNSLGFGCVEAMNQQ